jgi:hypothetical protein
MTGTVVPMAIAPTNPNAAAVLAKVRMVPPFLLLMVQNPVLITRNPGCRLRKNGT